MFHGFDAKLYQALTKIFFRTKPIDEDINIKSNYGMLIQGAAESKIENLQVRNITFRVDENVAFEPRRLPYKNNSSGTKQMVENEYSPTSYHPAYFNVSSAVDVHLENICLYVSEQAAMQNQRTAIALDYVENLHTANCRRSGYAQSGLDVIKMENTTK